MWAADRSQLSKWGTSTLGSKLQTYYWDFKLDLMGEGRGVRNDREGLGDCLTLTKIVGKNL